MWYRLAQQSSLKYSLVMDPNKTTATFTSPVGKDGFPLYPTVNIILKFDDQVIKWWYKIHHTLESEIKTELIPKIMEDILDIFVKYPPGVIPKLTRNTPITIVSKCTNKYQPGIKDREGDDLSGKESAGYYNIVENFVALEYDAITEALDHEMGHALDSNGFFARIIPGGESHSNYGKNNSMEAFAEAYELLAYKGINYRFPNTDEKSIKNNLILDYVADKIKSKGLENFQDFGSQIKFNVRDKKNKRRKNLYGARLTALVGGFQSAYDRFQGDKSVFLNKLFSDKQVQNDIVAYVNKSELAFFITPATNEEITLALESFKKSSDKKKDDSNTVKTDRFTSEKKESKDEEYDLLTDYWRTLPKSIKDFLDKNPQLMKGGSLEKEQFIGQINNSFVNDVRVPVNRQQWLKGNGIISYFETNKLIGDYDLESESIGNILEKIIPNIFPNLKFNNPEDYLFYDFHKAEDNTYKLDENSVRQKLVQAVNSDKYLKKIDETRKNKVIDDLMISIRNYANKTIKLINQYETGNTVKYMTNQFNTFFNRNDNLSLAKKAVDKLFTSQISRKNILFMRIYNNSKLSEGQKQELLNYYKTKQAQVIRK